MPVYEEREEMGNIILQPDGQVCVRKTTVVLRDGIEISRNTVPGMREPGKTPADDVLDDLPADARTVLRAHWTGSLRAQREAEREAVRIAHEAERVAAEAQA